MNVIPAVYTVLLRFEQVLGGSFLVVLRALFGQTVIRC